MKKTVLLIEDNVLDAENIKQVFEQHQITCELHIAKDGADALEMLTADKNRITPDVILLDMELPKMSGMEFLRIINNYFHFKKIETYILGACEEDFDGVLFMQFRIAGCLLKPSLFNDDPGSGAKKLFRFLSGRES